MPVSVCSSNGWREECNPTWEANPKPLGTVFYGITDLRSFSSGETIAGSLTLGI